ncbi:MAG: hypothetical protein PHO37_19060 [Kiritimatiellae bacterium]|nr:hypothetical protein [Kiritimatiellia bacterium]
MNTKQMLLTAAASLCLTCAMADTVQPASASGKHHAIIIQGAGYLPESQPPAEGADAVTQATTKSINTYTLSAALALKLKAQAIDVTILPHTACREMQALTDGSQRKADLIIFAGPSHFNKQPPQLTKLYRKLGAAVENNSALLCTTLVPAWYPETKGQATIKVAAKAFEKAGAGVVEGVSILTPQDKKKGASEKEIDVALTDFAARITAALKAKN